MEKLAYGVPSRHVKASHGADTDLMKFYSTTNSTTYGRSFSSFEPRPGRHTGTGYLSNFRPGVYYNVKKDFAGVGPLMMDNYESVTKQAFLPSNGPSGREPLPNQSYQVGSGFVRQKAVTIPTNSQVRQVCMDTRACTAPADYRPRAKPYLQKIQSKDPVELENAGYGPGYMTTEHLQQFKGYQPNKSNPNGFSAKEGSGFTGNHNVEPVTFHPDYAFRNDVPGYMTYRPTGTSIQGTDFRPYAFPKGDEPMPRIANRSVRDTAFTTGTKARPGFVHRVMGDAYDKAADIPGAKLEQMRKEDPTEYINTQKPNNHSSIATNIFQGQQRPSKSESDRLGNTSVGLKNSTGYSLNNDRFVSTSDNPARFITHYMTKFLDRNPKGLDREGHTWGGVMEHQPNGFTKSTAQHSMGDDINSTAALRRLEPYVGRSTLSRDPFFDDHTHNNKLHMMKPTLVSH